MSRRSGARPVVGDAGEVAAGEVVGVDAELAVAQVAPHYAAGGVAVDLQQQDVVEIAPVAEDAPVLLDEVGVAADTAAFPVQAVCIGIEGLLCGLAHLAAVAVADVGHAVAAEVQLDVIGGHQAQPGGELYGAGGMKGQAAQRGLVGQSGRKEIEVGMQGGGVGEHLRVVEDAKAARVFRMVEVQAPPVLGDIELQYAFARVVGQWRHFGAVDLHQQMHGLAACVKGVVAAQRQIGHAAEFAFPDGEAFESDGIEQDFGAGAGGGEDAVAIGGEGGVVWQGLDVVLGPDARRRGQGKQGEVLRAELGLKAGKAVRVGVVVAVAKGQQLFVAAQEVRNADAAAACAAQPQPIAQPETIANFAHLRPRKADFAKARFFCLQKPCQRAAAVKGLIVTGNAAQKGVIDWPQGNGGKHAEKAQGRKVVMANRHKGAHANAQQHVTGGQPFQSGARRQYLAPVFFHARAISFADEAPEKPLVLRHDDQGDHDFCSGEHGVSLRFFGQGWSIS